MQEAKRRNKQVLLITNEMKPDWVHRNGKVVGPRPELVQEMARDAGQGFHLVDVRTFLTLASQFLEAEVSQRSHRR